MPGPHPLGCVALSSLGERVDRNGVFFSRGGPGEGVIAKRDRSLANSFSQLDNISPNVNFREN